MICPPGYLPFDRIAKEVLDFIDFYYNERERADGRRDALLCKYFGIWASLPQCRSLSAYHPQKGLAVVSPRMVDGLFEHQPRPTYQGFFFIDAITGVIKPDRFADRLAAARQTWEDTIPDDDPFLKLDMAAGVRAMNDRERNLMAVMSAADYFEEFLPLRGWRITCKPKHSPGAIFLPILRRQISEGTETFGPLTTHTMALLAKGVTMEEIARIPHHKQMGEAYEAHRLTQAAPLQVSGPAPNEVRERGQVTRSRKKFERVKEATLKLYPDGLGTDEVQCAMRAVLAEVRTVTFSEKLFQQVRDDLWPPAPSGS